MWIRAYALSHFLSHDIAPLFLSLKVIYWHSAAYYCIVPKAHQSQNYFSINTLLQQILFVEVNVSASDKALGAQVHNS